MFKCISKIKRAKMDNICYHINDDLVLAFKKEKKNE